MASQAFTLWFRGPLQIRVSGFGAGRGSGDEAARLRTWTEGRWTLTGRQSLISVLAGRTRKGKSMGIIDRRKDVEPSGVEMRLAGIPREERPDCHDPRWQARKLSREEPHALVPRHATNGGLGEQDRRAVVWLRTARDRPHDIRSGNTSRDCLVPRPVEYASARRDVACIFAAHGHCHGLGASRSRIGRSKRWVSIVPHSTSSAVVIMRRRGRNRDTKSR